nr:integrase, catalytic region, zinc finger, CCHC-type, peptidase aspartic, catalytic [Tanacetum cinerariifolium]
RNTSFSQKSAPTFAELFEINELKAQSQEKDIVIMKLKEKLQSFSGDVKERKVKREIEEIETLNIELDHRLTKLVAENEHLKQTYKQLYDSIKPSRVRSKEQCDDLIKQVNLKSAEISDLHASLQEKVLVITAFKESLSKLKGKNVVNEVVPLHSIDLELLKIDVAPFAPKLRKNRTVHTDYIKHTLEEAATLREIVESERLINPLNTSLATLVIQIVLWYLDSDCSKHMTEDRSQLINYVQKFLGTVKFGNDHVEKIMGYGDYQIGNVTISQVYYVEGLGHNLFSVRQFYDSDLEVAFRQHTCFIRNLDGVDLLTDSRGNNLYTLSLQDMMASSPICLLSKASKTKSWLWHRRLSHLNFGAINHLARQGLVRGLPKLKFEKDHLCSTCAMGKSMKKSHKPKSEDTKQEKLYLLHMDLCGPMRVKSINGKNLGPALHEMTPATISSGLVQKYSSLIPFVPPLRNDWDLLFQPMSDELLNPPPSVNHQAAHVITPIAKVIPQVQDDSTGSPSLTTVDQDAPSASKFHTTTEIQSTVIPQEVEEDNLDIEVAHIGNDPLLGVLVTEVTSDQSSSTVSPHQIVQPGHPIQQHTSKWTKDHPLNNIISQLSRPVST